MTDAASTPFIEWRGIRHAYRSRQGEIAALAQIDQRVLTADRGQRPGERPLAERALCGHEHRLSA